MGFTVRPMEGTNPTESYAEWLAREMEERGFTQRGLAKAWNPDDVEIARRSIRRYLNGTVPTERTRIQLARALGSSESGPRQSDDLEADLHAC